MPCILLSCMANSQFRPAQWNARLVIFHSPPHPTRAASGGVWAIFMPGGWGSVEGLENPYYGLLSYSANSEKARSNQGGDSSGSSIWVRHPWLALTCKWISTPSVQWAFSCSLIPLTEHASWQKWDIWGGKSWDYFKDFKAFFFFFF